jgi:hypothetical protein
VSSRELAAERSDQVAARLNGEVVRSEVLNAPLCVGDDKTDSASDKANDPPRDDYWMETVVQEPTLNLEAFGGTRLEQAAAELL